MMLSDRPPMMNANMPGGVMPNMAVHAGVAQTGMPFMRAAAQYGVPPMPMAAPQYGAPWPAQGMAPPVPQGMYPPQATPAGYYAASPYGQPAPATVRQQSYSVVQPRLATPSASPESSPVSAISGASVSFAAPLDVPLSHGPMHGAPIQRPMGSSAFAAPAAGAAVPRVGAPMTSAPQGPSAAPRRSGVIVCIGDSLTAGKLFSKDSYPANLEKFLSPDPTNAFAYKNEGVFAETSDKTAQRLQSVLGHAQKAGPIAYVFILSGTNDIFQYRTPESILANLRQMHSVCANAPGQPCVAALTIPKCKKFTPQQESMRQAVNAGLQEILKLPAARPRFLVDLEPVPVELAQDEVHYNGQGYEEFAMHVHDALQRLWSQAA
eukprot:TRINITY_DN10220_c0_g1_i1.p1 TRINITY_DN10220_c0_g1~~TRINITY_DN10220_c0_g1_i1.p1  ORF type:complete len:378 (+),score=58.90 TRINITY_DN10220_c0_g1_i1:97-1230(+)